MAELQIQVDPQKLDWQSSGSVVCWNDREKNRQNEFSLSSKMRGQFSTQAGHLWLQSSGSTGEPKWIALSKQAFLHAADSVGKTFDFVPNEAVLNPLPVFHVGGLAMYARAFLHRQRMVCLANWDTRHFLELLQKNKVAWSSLVPTQVFDLVRAQIRAPEFLRGVFVGGAELKPSLYESALGLGWPLLKSFGMTEACSQIATQRSVGKEVPLKVLPHWRAAVSAEGLLKISGLALFTGYLRLKENDSEEFVFEDPKKEGWFTTEDLVELKNDDLHWVARAGDMVKIKGELVSLSKLRQIWQSLSAEGELMFLPHPRAGQQLVVVQPSHTSNNSSINQLMALVEIFNKKVSAIENIQAVYLVKELPKTGVGKINFAELIKQLQQN